MRFLRDDADDRGHPFADGISVRWFLRDDREAACASAPKLELPSVRQGHALESFVAVVRLMRSYRAGIQPA